MTEPTLFLTNICVLKWSGVKHLNWEFPIKIYSQLAGSWFPEKSFKFEFGGERQSEIINRHLSFHEVPNKKFFNLDL